MTLLGEPLSHSWLCYEDSSEQLPYTLLLLPFYTEMVCEGDSLCGPHCQSDCLNLRLQNMEIFTYDSSSAWLNIEKLPGPEALFGFAESMPNSQMAKHGSSFGIWKVYDSSRWLSKWYHTFKHENTETVGGAMFALKTPNNENNFNFGPIEITWLTKSGKGVFCRPLLFWHKEVY